MVVIRKKLAAERLHQQIGELLQDEVAQLPGDASRRIFWELMLASVKKNLPAEVEVKSEEAEQQPKLKASDTAEAANDLIANICCLADDICPAGMDFADSVREKAVAIGESVERSNHATDAQLEALENMLEGIRRWFHD